MVGWVEEGRLVEERLLGEEGYLSVAERPLEDKADKNGFHLIGQDSNSTDVEAIYPESLE